MSAMSDYLENELIKHIFRTGSFTKPTALYVALYTAAPSDSGGDPDRIIAWSTYCGKQPIKNPLLPPLFAEQQQPASPPSFIPVPPDNRPPHWGF